MRGGAGGLTVRLIDDPAADGWLLVLEERALPASATPPLPPRAREVLDLLLQGLSEKEIAARLGLRPSTVHDHVKRLYAHFGVGSRAELMAYFLRRHLRSE